MKRWPELEAKRQTSANLSIDGALKLLAAPKSEMDGEPSPFPTGREVQQKMREQARERWMSREEVNKVHYRHLKLIAAIGTMLNAAEKAGVKQSHKFKWMCPAENLITPEQRHQILLALATSELTTAEGWSENWGLSDLTAQGLIADACRHFLNVPDDDQAVWWYDVAIGISKFARGQRPSESLERVCPCDQCNGGECIFAIDNEVLYTGPGTYKELQNRAVDRLSQFMEESPTRDLWDATEQAYSEVEAEMATVDTSTAEVPA